MGELGSSNIYAFNLLELTKYIGLSRNLCDSFQLWVEVQRKWLWWKWAGSDQLYIYTLPPAFNHMNDKNKPDQTRPQNDAKQNVATAHSHTYEEKKIAL